MIELKSVLTKEQLRQTAPFKGAINAEAIDIDGTLFAPETLQFAGFVGAYDDGDYRGRAKFTEVCGVPDGSALMSFGPLIGALCDGVHTQDNTDGDDQRPERHDEQEL